MSMTDPIADLFVRIRNAAARGYETVSVPASRVKAHILSVFQQEGFIHHFEQTTENSHPVLTIHLRYVGGRDKKSVITGIRRISKPGRRVYVGKTEIPRVMGGLGVAVLSTSKGIIPDREARRLGVGGEVLCHIW
ncbi:MAG: 30S ribosomal protein S8 [Nitrospirae bacterium]|nr:MAG: 30S ribosomal protein S8 [Nitrospirota bacterium]